jgi:hypothetical protein
MTFQLRAAHWRKRARARCRSHSRSPERERGSVVVEVALITPLLFFIIFMIIETGPLFLQWSSNKHASQEGARMATVAGTWSTADYQILNAMEEPLKSVGSRLDYIIVFRAKNFASRVPPECKGEADTQLAAGADGSSAVGFFRRTPTAGQMKTGDDESALSGWDWNIQRPDVACNVYFRNSPTQPETRFQYLAGVSTATLSLDRFWPANKRNDSIAARQDYAGVYVKSRYTSMTNIIKAREISTTYVGILEALKVKS